MSNFYFKILSNFWGSLQFCLFFFYFLFHFAVVSLPPQGDGSDLSKKGTYTINGVVSLPPQGDGSTIYCFPSFIHAVVSLPPQGDGSAIHLSRYQIHSQLYLYPRKGTEGLPQSPPTAHATVVASFSPVRGRKKSALCI